MNKKNHSSHYKWGEWFYLAKNKVEISGLNTNEIVVLSSDETNELFKRLRNGDLKIKKCLILLK